MKKFCLILVLFALISVGFPVQSKLRGPELIDSLLTELPRAKEDSNKVSLLAKLSKEYYRSDPHVGIKYGKEGLNLAKKINWKPGMADCSNSIGINYDVKGDYAKALEYYKNSLKLNQEIGDKRGIAKNLGNIGIAYMYISDNDRALEYYFRALEINEELGNRKSIAINFGNIAVTYQNKEIYDKALEYLDKAIVLNKELGNKSALATNYGNIANISLIISDYAKAFEYFNKAINLNEEIGNLYGMATNLGNIGKQYYNLHFDDIPDSVKKKNPSINFDKKYNLDKSIYYNLKAAKLAEELEFNDMLIFWYKNLQNSYREKGNYKLAYEYMGKWADVKDLIFNQEKSKEIGKLEAEREQIEKEYKRKEELREIENEISYRNNIQYSAITIIIILLFTSIFIIPRMNIPRGVTEALVFITFLLFYELILVITEPWLDNITEGVPVYKMGLNIAIALLFIPFHRFEKKLRNKYTKK